MTTDYTTQGFEYPRPAATCNWCEDRDVPATHNLDDPYEWACDIHYATWFVMDEDAS